MIAIFALGLAAPAFALDLGVSAAPANATSAAVVTTPQVRAELVSHAPQGVLLVSAPEGVSPKAEVWLGLQLAHQPAWHTYWLNSGDSGQPTELTWTLPNGVTAGPIQWPVPKKIPIGPLANFGYEGTVLLPVKLKLSPDFKPVGGATTLPIKLHAAWLVCRQECIPEEGDFTLNLPIASATAGHRAAFEAAWAAAPRDLTPAPHLPASSTVDAATQTLRLAINNLPVNVRGQTLGVFPEEANIIANAAPIAQRWQGATWHAEVQLSPERSTAPSTMTWVLTPEKATDGAAGWRIALPVSGTWPKAVDVATVSPALTAALAANASAAAPTPAADVTALGLVLALVGAFVGGMILNLMPCVFPVLAIKALGFTQHGADRTALARTGWAYTAGVVLSFLALGGLLLALRAAGQAVGWGFQLQSPWVVAGLAALFTVIGLNLAGLFEWGNVLPSGLAAARAKNPTLDAFWSGVLAVAVASPCTAPFMGASLGVAMTLPAVWALALFACLGLGMALPLLAASLWPALAHRLPRPGAWMQTFRQAMAFPMFATVVWLVWVLGQQSGVNGAATLLALLLALALGLWAWTLRGKARAWFATLFIAIFALIGWQWGYLLNAPATGVGATASAQDTGDGWQAWSPGKVESLVAERRAVFVDFTAAWCVTCQVNKATTLSRDDVKAAFAAKNVALLRADWTRRDPAITAALTQLGRSGVPVYVLHAPGRAPQVFTEILSASDLKAALATL